jgi:hypothetical protein
MPKKLKLSLKSIKVQSFVTSLKDDEKKNVHGGTTQIQCETEQPECPTLSCGGTCEQSCYGTCTVCGTCNTCVTTPCYGTLCGNCPTFKC